MRSFVLAALLIAIIGHADLAGADQPAAGMSKHVLKVKRDRENRAVHLVQIDGVVFRDSASFWQQIESMPTSAVLFWRTPMLMERIVFDDCYLDVAELAALCRERGVVCDFEFGCYF
jgi:hypothetical protein